MLTICFSWIRPLPSVKGIVKTFGSVPAFIWAAKVGAVQLYSSELTVIQGYLRSNSVICLFSASTVSCATPGRSTPTEMVTGLWGAPVLWAVDVSVGGGPAMEIGRG